MSNVPDLSVLAGKPQPQPGTLPPGVPMLNIQIAGGPSPAGPAVIFHIHTPAGVLACHIPTDKIEGLTNAMRAAASGITIANG